MRWIVSIMRSMTCKAKKRKQPDKCRKMFPHIPDKKAEVQFALRIELNDASSKSRLCRVT
jgi:hypothetical protein